MLSSNPNTRCQRFSRDTDGLQYDFLPLTHPSWTDRTEEDELAQSSLGNRLAQRI